MQNGDEQQQWQQPNQAGPAAPYQPIPEDEVELNEDTALETDEQQPFAQDAQDVADDMAAPQEEPDDGAVVRWQAPEYFHQDQSPVWYIVLAIVTAGLMALAIFLLNSPTFAFLLPVMAVALVIYTRRPATIADYVVSRKGVHINDRLHPYSEFRSFGVMENKGAHTAVLVPRKRFQLGLTLIFPEEVGEPLVDMLAARLPMKEVKPDMFDKITSRLHL